MKITIEAETDAEKAILMLKEPWVRVGCLRLGVSGIGEPSKDSKTGEFGFLHGDTVALQGDMTRLIVRLNAQLMQQTAVNGTLQAHQLIANSQMEQRVAQELAMNRNGLKLARP